MDRLLARLRGTAPAAPDALDHDHILESIVDSSPVGLLVVDADGRFVLTSRAAREILGQDLTGRTISECREHLDLRIDEDGTPCPEDDLPAVRALRGGKPNAAELFLPERGERRAIWITCRARPIRDDGGSVRGAVIAFEDMTRRRRVETALREQKIAQQRQVDRQSALAEVELAVNEPHELLIVLERAVELTERLLPATRATIVICDETLRVTVDQAVADTRSRSAAFAELIARDGDATRWIVENKRALAVADINDDPFRTPPAGDPRPAAYAGMPIIADDRVLGVLYALDDRPREHSQTDLDFLHALANRAAAAIVKVLLYRQLREANASLERHAALLGEKEKRFRMLADTAPVHIWMSDKDQKHVWFNRTALEFTGRAMDEELGDGWVEGVHHEDRERILSTYDKAFKARNPFRMEYQLRRHDGAYRWLLDIGNPRIDDDGTFLGYVGTCIDITYRRETELELQQQVEEQLRKLRVSDRLASIGTLTAGLGHDMNNVLFPVRCRLDALDPERIPFELRELLRSITQSVEYLQQLSSGLRLCALDAEDEHASGARSELASWWRQVRPLITHAVADRAELEVHIPDDLPTVAVAPHRLTQALLNLVVNSADAMPEGGTIRVVARHVEDERMVELSVRDPGTGMTPKVKTQVLDPFFTTKPRRLSTGLGLSLVRGVVVSCGGTIDIESAPNKGTTVTLGLPAIATPEQSDDVRVKLDPAVVSLEDSRTAAWVSGLLRSAGYEPRIRSDPDDANLWITDPAPDRVEAARAYLAEDARHRVIVIGGNGGGWESTGALVVEDGGRLESIRAAIDDITGGKRGSTP